MTGSARSHIDADSSVVHAHVIAMLAVHGAPSVELAVPRAVFETPHPDLTRELDTIPHWYEVRSAADDYARESISAPDLLDHVMSAGTIIVSGAPGIPPDPVPALQHTLRNAQAGGARIVGIGSGVFVLAAAGVLAGRHATTHWSVVDELRRHPDVIVEDYALYTVDDGIYTCAGGGATLDLCLELVRHDHGAAVAAALARWMVAPPPRTGEQRQVPSTPAGQRPDRIAHLLDWASARLDQPLSLADLAETAGVSPRTLARRFHATLGTTPLQWLLTQRIRYAQELLESTEHSIGQIAALSGLGSPGNLRQQFTRSFGASPHRYRRQFRASRQTPRR